MNGKKDGFSIKEIEGFTRKHRVEVFFILSFFLALLFGYVFFRKWTLPLTGIGGILGILIPAQIESFTKKIYRLIFSQELPTQLIIAGGLLAVSIFLPFLIFLLLGLHGGKSMYYLALNESHNAINKK